MYQIFKNGGPVMYPLLACSLIVLTVILERALFWIKIECQRRRPLVDEVLELCRDFSMLKAMEAAAADEVQHMRRFMGVLDTMITVAPLLGILGTVLGIITSFEMLGVSGIEAPHEVTAGVAQALITTATGLSIAILSVFPYNYFNAKVERAALDMEKYATSLEIVYEKLSHEISHPEGDGP